MLSEHKDRWVERMAEELVCEIADVMSGIHLRPGPWVGVDMVGRRLEGISGSVDGQYKIDLQFVAEPRMFTRLTREMTGHEPDSEEVQDYAMEFFNVLCGRFISELYKATGTSGRFFPTRYEIEPDLRYLRDTGTLTTLYFLGDAQELAAFSWSAVTVNELLRRNMNGEA